jgi:hypothetical protein
MTDKQAIETGARLDKFIHQREMTHAGIAKVLKVSRPAVTRWVSGLTIVPLYIHSLLEFYYGLSKKWLYEGEGLMYYSNHTEFVAKKIASVNPKLKTLPEQVRLGEIISKSEVPDKIINILNELLDNEDLANWAYYEIKLKSRKG